MEKYNIKIILLPLILLLLFCFVSIFFTPMWGDEIGFHYPNAQNISLAKIIDTNSTYSSAYTPFPYILGNIVYKISNTIFALRILNYLIFIALIFFIYRIALHLEINPLLLVLLIISNPYILRSSFVYYMTNYGLLFSIIGIYYYFFSPFKYKQILSHLFFALAVLSQQWMLIIIFSIILNEITLFLKKDISLNYLLKSILYKIIIISPALLLFYSWGGLTHPNFQAHTLKPSFEHLNAVLANLGFAGLFISLFSIKKYFKISYIPLIFIIPIIWLTIPIHSEHHGIEVITGVAAQLSSQISKFILIPYKINMLVLIIFGILLLMLTISKRDNDFLKYTLLGFIIALTSNTRLGASHIFVSLPFLFLLFSSELKEKRLLQILITTQLYLTSLFYVIYYSFFVVKDLAL